MSVVEIVVGYGVVKLNVQGSKSLQWQFAVGIRKFKVQSSRLSQLKEFAVAVCSSSDHLVHLNAIGTGVV